MPELPEVETIRKTLEQLVVEKTIQDTVVLYPKIVKYPLEVEQFQGALVGQTIHQIDRRGKFLKFILDDYVLVSHLRMEGKYRLDKKEIPYDKHTHVRFCFQDETELRYHDVRKFGTMHLFKKGEEETIAPLKGLGPEPFSPSFTAELLYERLQKTTRKIKPTLLDQAIVVGLGNIYVDEALFRASIHPETIAQTLSKEQVMLLHEMIVETLQEAVEQGGSTIRSYVNSQGQMGMFQVKLNVYGQEGKPCTHCQTTIEKIKVSGRGTHFCPVCQPNK
ncbi:DNA-formamidopyrimidine glycosylase [Massilibacterium senegalense]|uniref:DNA-formamidopyrimidine glycosylase n=1 Tax=Massilibacterium senegalense TaxID=1632858 RepID=UPI000785BEF9|nr:DNA-formamidopyrimidine glycosylase [Massilibacterium senegalense]